MAHTITRDTHSEQVGKLIVDLKFDEAEHYLATHASSIDQAFSVLHGIAEHSTGILTYTFISHLINKRQSAYWHQMAAMLMFESLQQYKYSHQIVLYHLRQALALAPDNIALKEYMMEMYRENLITRTEALPYAHDVLRHDPTNGIAKDVALG